MLGPYMYHTFLVATPLQATTPLGAGTSPSEGNIAQSTLVECTSFKVESDLTEESVDGADTLSPTSRVLLRWVGGVLWLLPTVVVPCHLPYIVVTSTDMAASCKSCRFENKSIIS